MAEQVQRLEVAQQLQTTGKNITLNIMRLLLHLGTLHTRLGYWRGSFRTGKGRNCLCSRVNLLEMRNITGWDGNVVFFY